jgi:hypothetical protein
MAAKPSKQQVAQAKARAGGNNPIKVTKAGVKRLGKAGLVAASLTPVGRGVKIAATAKGAVKAAALSGRVSKAASAAKRTKIMAKKPSPSVKVVPARGKSYNKFANEKEMERLWRTSKSKTTSSRDSRGRAKQDYEVSKIKISDNVTARVPAKSNYEFAKDMSRFGKIQKQNAGPLQTTKAEAKANARALKFVNKKKK